MTPYLPHQGTVDMTKVNLRPGKRVLAHLEGFTSGHIAFGTGHWTHADVVEELPEGRILLKLLVTPLGVQEAIINRDHLKPVPGETYD